MCSTSRVAESGPIPAISTVDNCRSDQLKHQLAIWSLLFSWAWCSVTLVRCCTPSKSTLGQLCNFLCWCMEHVDKTGIHFQPCPPFTHNFISLPHFLSPCRHSLSLLVLHFNPAHPPGLHLCPCCLGGVSMETGQHSSRYLLQNSLANSLAQWANADIFLWLDLWPNWVLS